MFMESALLVLGSPNRGNSGLLSPNPAYTREIISRLIRTVNVSILLPEENDVKKYQDSLNRDFGFIITVTSLAEVNRHKTEPRDTRMIDYRPFVDQSAQVFEYISQFNHDIVIFDVFGATGFIPIRSKRTGLGLEKTLLVSWFATGNEFLDHLVREPPADFDPFMIKEQRYFAEKYCCENSDVVVSHTDTILKWALERDWKIDRGKICRLDDLKAGRSFWNFSDKLIIDHPGLNRESLDLKKRPLVSLCVAHYNDGQNLRYLLKSLEENDYSNFEVIVVDDGSTDIESVKIVGSLASEYASNSWRFIMKETNEGPGPTRNFAVSHARAEFIIFMDSDDLAANTMISDFVKGMLVSGVDCLTCSAAQFSGDTSIAEKSGLIELSMPLGACSELLLYPYFFGGTNFCVKKSVFEALQGFSDILGITEDRDFLARLVLAGFKMDVIPKGIYFYRIRSDSRFKVTGSSNSMQVLRKRLLLNAGSEYNKMIHRLLLREIAENERLRRSAWKLDRKIVKIALKLSELISEERRMLIEKILSGYYCKLKGLRFKASQLSKRSKLMIGNKFRTDDKIVGGVGNQIDGSKFCIGTFSEPELKDHLGRLELPSNRPVFGFVGELSENTRPLAFLRLAYWMQMSGDDSFFVMVGDGELVQKMQAAATKYRLLNFKWIPFLERPEELYAVLSGLIITSISGQRGQTQMFEALACGVPFFSTDVGQTELLLGQYGGGVVVRHDPERKDFAECFKFWKDHLEIYKSAAMESAELIRTNSGA
jgi:glycosyltransferase involved in cell wall biosynthesis